MLLLSGIADNKQQAINMLYDALNTKRALDKLGQIIAAQGGNAKVVYDTSLMPRAKYIESIFASVGGFLSAVDCRGLGVAAGELGAGRITKDDSIDLSVGFILKKRIGDRIEKGNELFEIHANDKNKMQDVKSKLEGCLIVSKSAEKPILIYDSVF